MYKKLIFVLLMTLTSAPAFSASNCIGKVKNVLIYRDGTVNVFTTYRNNYTVMCSVEGPWKNIGKETCKSILSTLLTAQSTGKDITAYYEGDQYTCQNMPTYSNAPGAIYIGIQE